MNSIFDIIRDGFFNPLTRTNKKFNEIMILKLFSITNELKENNDRSLIEDYLTTFLDEHPYIEFESNVDDEDIKSNNERVKYTLNYLRDSGWIFEEPMGNNIMAIQFEDYAHKFINTMIEIKEGREVKYDQYLKIMETHINNHKLGNFSDFEIINTQSDHLINMLRSLNSNIQRYYNKAIQNKDKDELSKIVKIFLEYKYEYFDKTYYKYITEESSKKSFRRISEEINKLRENNYSLYITDIIKEFELNNLEAEELFNKTVDNILTNISEIRYLDARIDRRNQQYTATTINKIYYLINRSGDIKGLLNNIIDLTVNHNQEENEYIDLFNVVHYNFDKISKPRQSVEVVEVYEETTFNEVSDEYIKRQLELHQDNLKYSFESINEFVLDQLKNKKEITGKDFVLTKEEDFIKLIMVIMYHTVKNVSYNFESLGETITNNKYEFKNFIIRRKENVE